MGLSGMKRFGLSSHEQIHPRNKWRMVCELTVLQDVVVAAINH